MDVHCKTRYCFFLDFIDNTLRNLKVKCIFYTSVGMWIWEAKETKGVTILFNKKAFQ